MQIIFPYFLLCEQKLERRAIIYKHFVNILSLADEKKKELLTVSEDQVVKHSTCYMNVYSTFMDRCHYAYYLVS